METLRVQLEQESCEKRVRREQAFKVEMAATAEGFDGDRAFVGNHWPVEISCHVIVNSIIILQELGGGLLKRFPFSFFAIRAIAHVCTYDI